MRLVIQKIKIGVALLAVFTLPACLKDKAEPIAPPFPEECSDTVKFSNEILTEIINPSCNTAGCHNATSASAGYVFSDYSNVSANKEIILKVLKHEPDVIAMPYGGEKLADSLIKKFDCWLKQGALNN